MAYVSKENKAEKAPKLRALAKQYGLRATVAVDHYSTLVLNISGGKIDFIGNYNETKTNNARNSEDSLAKDSMSINPYWFHDHFTGTSLEFLIKAFGIMNEGNFNKSDIMTDYHHVGWYVDINIGRWNKPYVLAE